jgi:hypothetical protein
MTVTEGAGKAVFEVSNFDTPHRIEPGSKYNVSATITNTGDDPEEVVFRLRVSEFLLASETVVVPAGETRTVELTEGGLPDPNELAITRNGQKVGFVRVTDDG